MSRLRALFEAALELPADEREEFIRRATGEDSALARQLLGLIDADAEAAMSTGQLAGGVQAEALRLLEAHTVIGLTLGRYRVVAPLGAGGMGSVFLAERSDGAFAQRVAVKFIHVPQHAPDAASRLHQEKDHLASLRHPYICRVLDAGIAPNAMPYVVMELAEGIELLEFCDARSLPIDARLIIFRRILAALNHAHAALIVHCDIKSSNVLVGEDGLPKLLDFGIARLLSESTNPAAETDAFRFLSPATAAPEQFQGAGVSVATDIYSLGNLLYELVCGRSPFELSGCAPAQVESIVRDRPVPSMLQRAASQPQLAALRSMPPRAFARVLGGDLEWIVQRCLRKDPTTRYGNVEQLDRDIAAVLEHRPIAERADERLYRVGRFLRRQRVPALLSVLLGLALSIGAVMLTRQHWALVEQRNLALTQRDRAEAALGILEEAFLAADPSGTSGIDTRIGQVLDAAESPIDTVARDQPEIAASLYRTLAEVHFGLRSDRRAAQLAERARAHAEIALPPEELPPYWVLEARTLVENARFDDALVLLERARSIGLPLSAEWYVARSKLASLSSESHDAVGFATHAVDLVRDRGPEDRIATVARWQLAESLRAVKDFDAALQTLDETLEWQRRGSPEQSRELLTRLRRIHVLEQSGAGGSALQAARDLVEEIDRRYGTRSVFGANARVVLGNLLLKDGDTENALLTMEEALEIQRDELGPLHPTTILHQYNIAIAQWSIVDRTSSTEAHLRAAFEHGRRSFGATSNAVTLFRAGLAQLLNRQGKWQEALDLLTDADVEAAYPLASEANQSLLLRQLRRGLDTGQCAARRSHTRCEAGHTMLARLGDAAP